MNFLWLKMSSNNNKNKKNDNTFLLSCTFHETQRHFTCEHKSNTLQANLKTYIIQTVQLWNISLPVEGWMTKHAFSEADE